MSVFDWRKIVADVIEHQDWDGLWASLPVLVRAFVFSKRLPPTYSPTGKWDQEAMTELLVRLMEEIKKKPAILQTPYEQGFNDYQIIAHFKTLIRWRVLSAYSERHPYETQLRKSIQETLRKYFRDFGNTYWGLPDWDDASPCLSDTVLRDKLVAIHCALPPTRRSTKNLLPLLTTLLGGVGTPVPLALLIQAINQIFGVYDFTEVAWEETEEAIYVGLENVPDQRGELAVRAIEMEDFATSVISKLSQRQRLVFQSYFLQDLTLEQTATQVGCGKSTVHNEVEKIKTTVAQNSFSVAEQDLLFGSFEKGFLEIFPSPLFSPSNEAQLQ